VGEQGGWRAALGVGSPALTEPWFWRLVVAIAVTVVMQLVGYTLGAVGGLLVGVFGSVFFATLLVMALVFVLYARRVRRSIATLLDDGGALAHWVYTPADLAVWGSIETRRRDTVLNARVWWAVGGTGAIAALAVVLSYGISTTTGITVVVLAGVLAGTVGLIRVMARRQIRVNDMPHLDRGRPELYIGPTGLYQPGPKPAFQPLSWGAVQLDTITTERDDLLVIVCTQHYTSASQHGVYRGTNIIRVAVPSGEEDTAGAVVEQLQPVARHPR
jgi:hypothetical protein